MAVFFIIILLMAAALESQSMAVGGNSAKIRTYPYQVSVAAYGAHTCGGSIISPRFILTAAHCVNIPIRFLTVRSGSSYWEFGEVSKVQKVIRHEKYKIDLYGVPIHDIALLLLNKPLTFNPTRQPVDLFEEGEEAIPGIESITAGWGIDSNGIPARQLQVVSLPIISKSLCSKYYRYLGGVRVNQICADNYGRGGKGFCDGDSGSPLMIEGRQAGIVSWSIGCGQPGFPGVYTEVAQYRPWIDQKIKKFELHSSFLDTFYYIL